MTPREFIDDVMQPNINEFEKEPTSLRHAMNAVLSVDALAAYVYQWCKKHGHTRELRSAKDDTEFRNELASENSAFALLRDLAKALKHVCLERGKPIVKGAEQMTAGWSAPGSGYGSPYMGYGKAGAYGTTHAAVTPDKHSPMLVLQIVQEAAGFLNQECTKVSI